MKSLINLNKLILPTFFKLGYINLIRNKKINKKNIF